MSKLFQDSSGVLGTRTKDKGLSDLLRNKIPVKEAGFEMNITNANTCEICRVSTTHKPHNPIELTCGHAFGKSCLRNWVESSNQENCFLCNNPLTDDEIKEINNIPLQERAVIITKKAITLFGRTISKVAPTIALGLATTAAVAGSTTGAVAAATGLPVGVAIGAVGVAAGAVIASANTVAGVAAGSVAAASGVNRAAGGAIAAATAGTVGTHGVVLATQTLSTALGVAGSIGVAPWLGIGSSGAVAGAVTGAIVANWAYDEQEKMNPAKKPL